MGPRIIVRRATRPRTTSDPSRLSARRPLMTKDLLGVVKSRALLGSDGVVTHAASGAHKTAAARGRARGMDQCSASLAPSSDLSTKAPLTTTTLPAFRPPMISARPPLRPPTDTGVA